MKLAKMKKKCYTRIHNKGAMGFICTKGDFEFVKKVLNKSNTKSVAYWNSINRFIEMMENTSIPLSEEEKKLRLRVAKDGSPKNHCFEYGEFVEIWKNTFMYGGPGFVGLDLSKKINQLIVGLEMKVSRSRIKKYNKTFTFLLYVADSRKALTMGEKYPWSHKDILPDVECLNMALKSNVTQDELEELWRIRNADEFIARLEKLFHIRFFYDVKVLENEFDCLKETMWYGIYKEKPIDKAE